MNVNEDKMTQKQLSTDTPWDQYTDETDKAYHRFSVYLELGAERSLDKTRQELGKSSGYIRQLETWCSKYDWVERAAAFDRHVIRTSLKNKEDIMDEMTGMVLDKAKNLLSEMIDMGMMDGLQIVGGKEGDSEFAQTMNVYTQKLKAIESALDRIGFVRQKEKPEVQEGATTMNNYIQTIYAKMELRDKELGRD